MWIRTCQECGNVQFAKQPKQNEEITDSYRAAKCRKCKSEALDYGKDKQPTTLEVDWAE